MKKRKVPLFFVKWLNYEYWPFWLFFLPLVPYWIYLAIRAKSFTYFTAANPGIEHGGVFGESKIDILNKINKRYLPKTIFFKSSTPISAVMVMINENQIDFPLIIKPNVGERGDDVEKIDNQLALQTYLNSAGGDLIIQEFVDYEIELGVLYYRFPDSEKTGITSVVVKEFLTVIGDGKSTITELLEENDRARFQLDSLMRKLGDEMNIVLAKGQKRNLQPIGNHCKGTKFLSAMNLLNPKLVQVFDDVALEIEGFYFGRFDLKVKSIEDLYIGKNIKILELNGVTSEPAHIYDPSYSLWRAYSETARNMKMMFRVSRANIKQGVKVTPLFEMIRLVRAHFNRTNVQIQGAQ
jgi:regulator of replication initiation timing